MIALVVLLLISSQLPAWVATRISYVPRSFVALITKPAALLHSLSTSIRPGEHDPADFSTGGDLVQQLEQARAYIDNLEQDILRLRNLSDNLAIINALVDTEDIRFVGAKVIGFNGDRVNPILSINIGSDHGVRDGLAVVWGADLVGKVVSTSVSTSDVQLITASGTSLQVRITKPVLDPSAVPMPAFITLSEDGRTFVTDEFPLDAPIHTGDLALLADDSWQFRARGFIVGRVIDVQPHPDRPMLNLRVRIQPQRTLASLHGVIVLVPVE
ncbi:MAG: hypothetical protein Kow00105_17950 [Phycisphaeraceae bacterium]